MNQLSNLLLEDFDLAPFSKVKSKNYLPAIQKLIDDKKREVDSIISNQDKPNFKNTIEKLEYSGEKLDRVTRMFFNINSAETNPEIQKIAQKVFPLLKELDNHILLNNELFTRVKSVFEMRSKIALSEEQNTLLNEVYKNFTRNGANLSTTDKKIIRSIDKEIALLSLKFSTNLLAETNNYELHLKDEVDLNGLPDGEKEAARLLAKNKGLKGWLITLAEPSMSPFLKYSENRNLRKKIFTANKSKCFKNNEFNNEDIVLKISKFRNQRANLLGYLTHADFVLEERMVRNPKKVYNFLNTLLEKAKPYAEKEFKHLERFAKQLDGLDHLEAWDFAFYSEKLKNKLFNLNDEKLKPYFKLDNVIQGVFAIAEKLFGISFSEVNNIDTWHDDVKTYEVKNKNNELISIFYADYHPREGKNNGAWANYLKSQKVKNGKKEISHVLNVCNFTKPTDSLPSLLTFNEVRTLFHEFGHALHNMLSNTTYPSLSGTNVYWDFVELPSQIMENWCYEEESLNLFARHYKTNESMPLEFMKKIKESSIFMKGIQTVQMVGACLIDMAWHAVDPTNITSVKENETIATKKTRLFPYIDNECLSVSIHHIWPGGYSSGLYSYQWGQFLDADAFEFFKERGIFNPEIGQLFQNTILSKGGTENPMTLYKRFRGREPRIEALLIRNGLLKN